MTTTLYSRQIHIVLRRFINFMYIKSSFNDVVMNEKLVSYDNKKQ